MLQPIPLPDTEPFFQRFHAELSELYGATHRPNKRFTQISHLIRVLYLEAIIEEKNFCFIHEGKNTSAIVVVDISERTISAFPVPKPPVDDMEDDIEKMVVYNAVMGILIMEVIEEKSCIWTDTSIRLCQELESNNLNIMM